MQRMKKWKSIIPFAMIMMLCVSGCAFGRSRLGSVNTTNTTTTTNTSDSKENTLPTEESKEEEVETGKPLDFEKLLAPADDEYDNLYASDYVLLKLAKKHIFRDSKPITEILGWKEATPEDIRAVLDVNSSISDTYKDFIVQYVKDWLELYPGTDFRIFAHNLKTLQIHEVDKNTMLRKTLSSDSVACYLHSENAIYVAPDLDLSKESDGYIIFTHELTHAARDMDFDNSKTGYHERTSFYEEYDLGCYTQEALITDFVYEMQGLGKRSDFYSLISSYFRIILDAIDYNGADFMNHSINYLFDRMNEYMGDDRAAVMIAQMEAQATIRFTSYHKPVYTDFTEWYDYIVRMYMKNHLREGMSYEEAKEQFDAFYDEILYHFTDIYAAYGITEGSFMPGFEKSLELFGIEH